LYLEFKLLSPENKVYHLSLRLEKNGLELDRLLPRDDSLSTKIREALISSYLAISGNRDKATLQQRQLSDIITEASSPEEIYLIISAGIELRLREIGNWKVLPKLKLPVIVALTDYAPLAWRFKNELNELQLKLDIHDFSEFYRFDEVTPGERADKYTKWCIISAVTNRLIKNWNKRKAWTHKPIY